jgi:Tol biopolymer transport system component
MKPTTTVPRTPPAGCAARRLIALVAVLAMAVLGLSVTSGPASAVVSGKNGRIVFTRRVCTSACVYEIVAADPNDTNETVLAGPYPRSAFDEHLSANWSPDGRAVVFTVNNGVWEVNSDGSDLHLLIQAAPGAGFGDGSTFTPDGKSIVVTHVPAKTVFRADLYVMNADGTGLKQLSTQAINSGDGEPQVSPDGKQIVFSLCRDVGCVVATMNVNGGNVHELTDPTLDTTYPNWSPDSKKIVFTIQPTVNGAKTEDIASINPDGSGFTQLSFNPPGRALSITSCFSPDGTKILFVHSPSTGESDLFTMSPDGTGIAQVTKTASREMRPQWAPVS